MFNTLLKKQKEKLEAVIAERQKIADDYVHKIEESQKTLQSILDQIKLNRQIAIKKQQEIESYKSELKFYQGIVEMEELSLEYTPVFNDLDLIATKKEEIQNQIAELIANEEAILTTRIYKIDGSESKGKKFQKVFCENLLIGFNSYFNKKKKSITTYNYNSSVELIDSNFDKINLKSSLMGVSINSEYLNLILDLLKLELDEKIAKAEEREKIKEERRRLREQEKLLAEAEKERKRLEEEKKAMNLAYNKALTEEERNRIVEQIQEIDKRIGDIDYRVSNPKAGWLYVIESPSLPGLVKIGVSRRLNGPFERVRELSGSSLPEAFKINGFCFSDDAFELENNMHKYFAKQRVNPNKEFFYITPQEAIKVLKEEFGCDIHFVNDEESEEEK